MSQQNASTSSASVFNGQRLVPAPVNEPVRGYGPGSPEKASLKSALKSMAAERIEIPLIIGGREGRQVGQGSLSIKTWGKVRVNDMGLEIELS